MEELLLSHGILALFLLGFLAATLMPLGSEWLLVALLIKGYDPLPAVAAATAGNTLGACTTYWIGLWGAPMVINKLLRIDARQQAKAEAVYARYGSWSLFFSWLPVVGDPLCLVGGILRVRFVPFFILVLSGKLSRYVLVSVATLQAL
ncbi:MAG: YqaA family protein [Thermodesulfobacteriota bacterium]|jgi:membrane protein YqaA with SNARE-associated domain